MSEVHQAFCIWDWCNFKVQTKQVQTKYFLIFHMPFCHHQTNVHVVFETDLTFSLLAVTVFAFETNADHDLYGSLFNKKLFNNYPYKW